MKDTGYPVGEDGGWECYNASEEEGQKRFGGDPPGRGGSWFGEMVW